MAKNKLIDKLIKASTTKRAATLNNSELLNKKSVIRTPVPALNVAYSGDVDGGLSSGFTMIAGPSKHFKSLLLLLSMKAYLDADPEAIAIFYDSEFGSSLKYFESVGINPADERVIHSPVTDVEELRHDIASTLKSIERGEKVFIAIDSIGNLASRKEVEDAEAGKNVADMTRAKQLKSLFRIITPHLTIKDIPLVAVNHTYKTLELYSKDVVGGGCVVSGTKIKMSDNTLKEIQDIKVGDEVITDDSTAQIVTHVWAPETLVEGNPQTYEVEFEDGYKVVCSEDHRFMLEDGSWKCVTELTNEDVLSVV